MSLLKFASITAILFSILFFLHSLLNLIGFAISTQSISINAIPSSIVPTITLILSNFTTISQTFTLLEAIFGAIILFVFERIAKKRKALLFRTLSILLLIATLLPGIGVLFSLAHFSFPFTDKFLIASTGILSILFGISLIKIRSSWETLATSLGILYFLEGLVLISTYWIPARLVEFSIAIALIEAVFFWKIGKQL